MKEEGHLVPWAFLRWAYGGQGKGKGHLEGGKLEIYIGKGKGRRGYTLRTAK